MGFLLNDKQTLVRQCIIMRLKEPEALAYLKASGHPMAVGTYWRIRGELQAAKKKRLYEIGQSGFEDQHLERIDQLELIQQELWKCYFAEPSHKAKAGILRHLAEIQPYLSTYYDTTRAVLELSKEARARTIDIEKESPVDISVDPASTTAESGPKKVNDNDSQ